MAARALDAAAVALPRFPVPPGGDDDPFALSSHAPAREALAFALGIAEPGFNVFVVGLDRSGRMTATMGFLAEELAKRPPPDDWLYLNNFRWSHRPRPARLPAGTGRRFRDRVAALVPRLREALGSAFGEEANQARLQARAQALRGEFAKRLDALREKAHAAGLEIVQAEQGLSVVRGDGPAPATAEAKAALEAAAQPILAGLADLQRWTVAHQIEAGQQAEETARQIAEQTIGPIIAAVQTEFAAFPRLVRWLGEMQADMLSNLARFQAELPPGIEPAERRYAVNLLVDRTDDTAASLVVEANPTYENLFGRIEYRQSGGGGLETDFTLLRPGALHRANGGVLVLRAEALAQQPMAWAFLKGALRDRQIRMEEPQRQSAVPIAGAPRPKPIPLALKVVLVGHPSWFYAFFMLDSDFRTYFRVKAEIDPDMPATPANVACYGALLQKMATGPGRCPLAPDAVQRLLGLASAVASDRTRLSAQFELAEDTIEEACQLAAARGGDRVAEADIVAAIEARRQRNGHIEEHALEAIRRGIVLIETRGAVIGQVNGLTYRDAGDHAFGGPSRVTARASVGRRGVVNIERDVNMGGPIQQKAAMILQGFLAGRLARRIPLSFDCSITFEQNYGGVEGDSASLAELVAVLSDLAELPVRQDVAVTGSVNQRGQAQAVGGVDRKIAGFYRTCLRAPGGLTGTQGCVVPVANETHLILDDDVAAAVAAGSFHIWSVTEIDEVLELMLGMPAGVPGPDRRYPADTIYGRVEVQLEAFNAALTRAEHRR